MNAPDRTGTGCAVSIVVPTLREAANIPSLVKRVHDSLSPTGLRWELLLVDAVGSRYVPGGHVDRAWGWGRRLSSRLATVLAMPLVRCSDPMSGFFATDRRALPDLQRLHPTGYKIGLELLVRGRLRVAEVPIYFVDRDLGSSKMGWRQQVNYVRHLYRLYLYRYSAAARLASFALVGASGFVVDLTVYVGLQAIGVEHRVARFLSFWPAVTWNWFLNRALTFAARPRQPRVWQWTRFVASSLIGLGVNVGSYTALTTFVELFARERLVALACGVALGGVANFLIVNRYVYR